MDASQFISLLIQASYFVAAVLLILGIKRMSSPVTARSGIQWAGVGVLVAVIATFFHHGGPDRILIENAALIFVAIALSTAMAWYSGKKVAMTDMPQMVALYNGMGGGSAAAIGASALLGAALSGSPEHALTLTQKVLAVVGALIGAVSFTGSLIAFAKLQGWMDKTFRFSGQQAVNGLCFLAAAVLGAMVVYHMAPHMIVLFFVFALLFGILMTLPIGGADMPVVISLYNAFTGLAVGLRRFRAAECRADHRRHRRRRGRHAADAADGEGDEPLDQQRAVLELRRRRPGGDRNQGFDETDRGRRCRIAAVSGREGHHRAGLRHGGRAGAAQDLGIGPAIDQARART